LSIVASPEGKVDLQGSLFALLGCPRVQPAVAPPRAFDLAKSSLPRTGQSCSPRDRIHGDGYYRGISPGVGVDHGATLSPTTFVIIDLEGTASMMVGQAMSRADFVIIPMKGSELDAIEAVKVIKFISRQATAYRRSIPYSVLFTQTNPAVRPRTLRSLEQDMLQQGIPLFGTALNERDAFRAIFSFGGTLSGLDPNAVSNVQAALNNARQFTAETIDMLKRHASPAHQAEVA
jgi:hypothetical protein